MQARMGLFEDNENYYIYQWYCKNNKEHIRSLIPCKNGLRCSFAKKGTCWFLHKEGQAQRKVLEVPKDPIVIKLEKFEDWSKAWYVKKRFKHLKMKDGSDIVEYGIRECEFGEDYDEDVF